MAKNSESLDNLAIGSAAAGFVLDLTAQVTSSEVLDNVSHNAWLFAGIIACSAVSSRFIPNTQK